MTIMIMCFINNYDVIIIAFPVLCVTKTTGGFRRSPQTMESPDKQLPKFLLLQEHLKICSCSPQ